MNAIDRPKFLTRFMSYVVMGYGGSSVVGSECWIWGARINRYGYGRFWASDKEVYAHRFSYESFVSSLTPGLCIDHLCKNRACVNPSHLEEVTFEENKLRSMSEYAKMLRVGICLRGHDPKVTGFYYSKRWAGKRCRACVLEDARSEPQDKKRARDAARYARRTDALRAYNLDRYHRIKNGTWASRVNSSTKNFGA